MALIISLDDAQDITARELSAKDITAATAIIELSANKPLDSDTFSTNFSTSDQRWLKRAIAYQAAWMEEHPEAMTRMDVASLSQGDVTVQHRTDSESLYLAPLAKKCLRRVSWLRTRSVKLKSSFRRSGPILDDDLDWKAMK